MAQSVQATRNRAHRNRARPLQFWAGCGLVVMIVLLAALGVAGSLWLPHTETPPLVGDLVLAPVPRTAIAAGTVIETADLTTRRVSLGDVAGDVALDCKDLIGRLAVKSLPASKPVPLESVDQPVPVVVPGVWVPAGADLAAAEWVTEAVAARLVTSATLLVEADLLPPGKVVTAKVPLPARQPVTRAMVEARDLPRGRYVAAAALPAYHLLAPTDVECSVAATGNEDPCRNAFDPTGQLLLKPVDRGVSLAASDLLTPAIPIDQVLELSLSAVGALGGKLRPGDRVQAFPMLHVVTGTVGVSISPVPSFAATVLGVTPEGTGYRVALGFEAGANVASLVALLPRFDFYLVLQP